MTYVKKLHLQGQLAKRLGKETCTFCFDLGVTMIIGPNGSGKSTILWAIRELACGRHGLVGRDASVEAEAGILKAFDFEKDSIRTKEHFSSDGAGMIPQLLSRFRSHGQVTKALLRGLEEEQFKGGCVLLDEPEQGLDFDGLVEFSQLLRKTQANQVLVATHHPVLILDPQFHILELMPGHRGRIRSALMRILAGGHP